MAAIEDQSAQAGPSDSRENGAGAGRGATRRPTVRARELRQLILAVVCALAVSAAATLPVFKRLHDLDVDVLHALRHAVSGAGRANGSPVAVVALDEHTYATAPFAGLPKVMWTPQIAAVQDAILGAGAKVIGWDLILPTSAATYVEDKNIDRPLLRSLARGKEKQQIVLGTAQAGATRIEPHRLFSWAVGGHGNLRSLNVQPDRDDVVRRVPAFLETQASDQEATYIPAFSLELAARRNGASPTRRPGGRLELNGEMVRGVAGNSVLLNFSPAATQIPTFSLADLYACDAAGNSSFFAEHFAGKVVLFGLVLDIEDRKLASNRLITNGGPVGPVRRCSGDPSEPHATGHARSSISGVYLHAVAVSNMLLGDGLEVFAPPARSLLTLPLATLGSLATMFLGLAAALTSFTLGAVVWTAAAIFLFGQSLVLPLLVPLVAGLLAFTTMLGLRFAFIDRDARFLRKAFASYMAPALVDQLIRNPESLKLGGERREMTFLFTDLAGFTSLIEQREPVEAVNLLNDYLAQMVEIAKRHRGTIDKVVGDALHVIFSAPVDQADHARRAVDCALEMDEFASRYAREKVAIGIPFGETRIGVNTGMAIVGNFGGNEFFDYTAHGDAINTAARLESVNKQFGTRLAVSAETVRQCPGFEGRPIGQLILKGKTGKTEVFEPLCDKAEQAGLFAEYTRAFDKMKRGAPGVKSAFSALAAKYPDDGLTRYHLRRLESGQTGDTITLADK